jgi:hypothetical protein
VFDGDDMPSRICVILWEVWPLDKAVVVVFHGITDASEGEGSGIVDSVEISMKKFMLILMIINISRAMYLR